jgi:hypothetical protein
MFFIGQNIWHGDRAAKEMGDSVSAGHNAISKEDRLC